MREYGGESKTAIKTQRCTVSLTKPHTVQSFATEVGKDADAQLKGKGLMQRPAVANHEVCTPPRASHTPPAPGSVHPPLISHGYVLHSADTPALPAQTHVAVVSPRISTVVLCPPHSSILPHPLSRGNRGACVRGQVSGCERDRRRASGGGSGEDPGGAERTFAAPGGVMCRPVHRTSSPL